MTFRERMRSRYWRFWWKIRNARYTFRNRLRKRRKMLAKTARHSRLLRFLDFSRVFVKGWPGTWREIHTAWLVSDPAYQGDRFERFFRIVRMLGCDDPAGNVAWAWEMSNPMFLVAWRWCSALRNAPWMGGLSGFEMGPDMQELFLHTATRRESIERIAELVGFNGP